MSDNPKPSGLSRVSRRRILKGTGASVAGASLAGCLGNNGDGSDGGSKSLTMLTAETDPASKEIYSNMADEFEEETGNTVEFEYVSFENLYSRLGQMQRGDNAPELMQAATAGLVSVYQDGLLTPITDTIEEIESDIGEVPRTLTVQAEGEIWSMPYAQKLQTQTIRRDLLEQAGHSFPEDPADRMSMDWETNMQWVRGIDENTDPRGIGVVSAQTTKGTADTAQYLWCNGVDIYRGETGNIEVTLDQGENRDRAIETLEFLSEMHQYSPEAASWGWGDAQQAMSSGQVASVNYSVGRVYSVVQDTNPEWSEDIVPYQVPMKGGDASRSDGAKAFTSPVGLVALEGGKNTEAAKEYIKFFFSTDLYFDFLLTVPMHLSPPIQDLFDSDAYRGSDKTVGHILDTQKRILPNASPMNITADGGFNPIAGKGYTEGTLGAMVGRVTIQGMDPGESIDQAAETLRGFKEE